MCPPRKTSVTVPERYDHALLYARDFRLAPEIPQPLQTKYWSKGSVDFLEKYHHWLLEGGISEFVTMMYHIVMAGHVFGLTLKSPDQLDLDRDLDRAFEYILAKGLSASWTKNCRNSLIKFRAFLRLERGLGPITKAKPFDMAAKTQGLPLWLVSELERFQRVQQRNWRTSRLEENIRRFWCNHLRFWRFLCQERQVTEFADLKRAFVQDYLDKRLDEGHPARGVNTELHYFHGFLLFLQDEGYPVPQSLLRLPSLKEPDSLPKYLTDEQVKRLRDDFEKRVEEATLGSKRRLALIDRAIFHLLWQCGMRVGEVEELRLEDLDLDHRRLSVRDGKGRKDRTVYVADLAVEVLNEYLAVRGSGFGDHVFLYRNAPLGHCFIGCRIKAAGERTGLKVYPHRLRHTCGTQLLNAGCRITSIQKYLGHKRLNTTMIYARVLDQTMADDYFKAMEKIEQQIILTTALLVQPPSAGELIDLVNQLFGSALDAKQIEIISALQKGLSQLARQKERIESVNVPMDSS